MTTYDREERGGPGTARPERLSTGLPGLDEILGGGLPRERVYLVQGDPGVGKTTLGLQFLLNGAVNGEKGLYLTLSETLEEIEGVALSHEWDLSTIDVREHMADEARAGEERQTIFHAHEVELDERTDKLLSTIEDAAPDRLVLDSISELQLICGSNLQYRRKILALKQFLAQRKITVLLLDDVQLEPESNKQLQSIAHGVISLEQFTPEFGNDRKRMRVVKIRGVRFSGGYHDYQIITGGISVYPRLMAGEHRIPAPDHDVLPSGLQGLDEMLGGGLDRGSSLLLTGPSGTGKSTLAHAIVWHLARRGEKAATFLFEEHFGMVRRRGADLGLSTEELEKNRQVRHIQVDPAEIIPGELAYHIRHLVENEDVRIVVLDSLSGYLNALSENQIRFLILHELLAWLAQRGVVTILVSGQQSVALRERSVTSGVSISNLCDTVLVFRHNVTKSRMKKSVLAYKRRGGYHSTCPRDLTFEDGVHLRKMEQSDAAVFFPDAERMAGG